MTREGNDFMSRKDENTRKRPRVGTVIFFTLYLLAIAAFFLGLNQVVTFLTGWLTDYEAAQPKVKCQQVFDKLFTQPDWAELYRLAGCADTEYESAEHYAAYMRAKAGDTALSYHETSAGLSQDKKYVVTLDGEKIATFTLTARESTEALLPSSEAQGAITIPDWEFGTLELFFSRRESVTVLTDPDCTVYVNGVALSKAHTIQTLHTEAENYLPEGLHGLRRRWQYLDGLLVHPEVTAIDASGTEIALAYDEATNTYMQALPQMVISQEQTNTVVAAAKSYCRFMISQESRYQLSKLFDPASEIFSTVTRREPWTHEFKSYSFTDAQLSGYYRYSDTLCSVQLRISLNVVRPWDTVKEYPLDATFFLQQQADGSWLVSNMTNVDVQEQTTLVRLTYIVGGETVHSEMVDAAAASLTPPVVTAPEGKTFTGWYRMEVSSTGITYSLAFLPDESGTVTFSGEETLESMTLYALFE